MIGEGKMWSPITDWGNAKEVLEKNGIKPIQLTAKEGLIYMDGYWK